MPLLLKIPFVLSKKYGLETSDIMENIHGAFCHLNDKGPHTKSQQPNRKTEWWAELSSACLI
jgi:hypothetical protein